MTSCRNRNHDLIFDVPPKNTILTSKTSIWKGHLLQVSTKFDGSPPPPSPSMKTKPVSQPFGPCTQERHFSWNGFPHHAFLVPFVTPKNHHNRRIPSSHIVYIHTHTHLSSLPKASQSGARLSIPCFSAYFLVADTQKVVGFFLAGEHIVGHREIRGANVTSGCQELVSISRFFTNQQGVDCPWSNGTASKKLTLTEYWKINEHHQLQFQTLNLLRTPLTIKHTSLAQRPSRRLLPRCGLWSTVRPCTHSAAAPCSSMASAKSMLSRRSGKSRILA